MQVKASDTPPLDLVFLPSGVTTSRDSTQERIHHTYSHLGSLSSRSQGCCVFAVADDRKWQAYSQLVLGVGLKSVRDSTASRAIRLLCAKSDPTCASPFPFFLSLPPTPFRTPLTFPGSLSSKCKMNVTTQLTERQYLSLCVSAE